MDKLKTCEECKNHTTIDTVQAIWIHCCIPYKYEILDLEKDCINCDKAIDWKKELENENKNN